MSREHLHAILREDFSKLLEPDDFFQMFMHSVHDMTTKTTHDDNQIIGVATVGELKQLGDFMTVPWLVDALLDDLARNIVATMLSEFKGLIMIEDMVVALNATKAARDIAAARILDVELRDSSVKLVDVNNLRERYEVFMANHAKEMAAVQEIQRMLSERVDDEVPPGTQLH